MASKRPPHRNSQQSIRDTVHLLFSLLSECGVPKAPLECFRQAKFNKSEATLNLWKLTFHITQLLQFLDGVKCDSSVHFAELSFFLSITERNLPTVQVILQQYMLELGYRRDAFLIPAQSVGSRELLLAFAWLLNRTNFFSKLTKHFLAVAKITEIPVKSTCKLFVEQMLDENRRLESDIEGVMSSSKLVESNELSQNKCTEALHKLVWLRGCVDQKWKSMVRAHLAYQKIAYRIHQSVNNCSSVSKGTTRTRDLCVPEVFHIRYPNQLKAYLRKLSRCVNMLQKLDLWQGCECLFWQWMESVVDLHEEEKAKQDKEDGHANSAGDDKNALLAEWSKLHEDIESLLQKNRLHLERLNRTLEHKTRSLEHDEVNREEQCIIKQLQCECPLVSSLAKSTSPVVTSMLQELTAIDKPVFVSVGAPVVHSSNAFSTFALLHQKTGAEIPDVTHALIRRTTDKVKVLDATIEETKSRIKKTLESLQQRLPATLCKFEQHPF